MTKEEILKMDAGRVMDALVAEKVMKLSACDLWTYDHLSYQRPMPCPKHGHDLCYPKEFIPLYSSQIGYVWEMVKKIDSCLHLKEHGKDGNWEALFCHAGPNMEATGETAPLAICRAALLTVIK